MKEFFANFPPAPAYAPFGIDLAGITYPDELYRVTRRDSPCLVAEYVISGSGTVEADGCSHAVHAGDVYILPPGKDHRYYSDAADPWEKIWFNASGSLVPVLLREYNPAETVVFRQAGGREFFEEMLRLGQDAQNPPAKTHAAAALIFHRLLQYLYGRGEDVRQTGESAVVREYIDCHYTENLSLAQLCGLVYLSESQLVRVFKRDLGKTPYEYCLELKLQQAQKLLRGTNLLVKEISAGLGFCDEHYFSSIFRKKTGLTPKQYRGGAR